MIFFEKASPEGPGLVTLLRNFGRDGDATVVVVVVVVVVVSWIFMDFMDFNRF